MKVSRKVLLGCMSVALLGACGGPIEEEELASETSALEQVRKFKSLSDGHTIYASKAELDRKATEVDVDAITNELNPGEQVDLLWAIFNEPSYCTNGNPVTGAPCGPPDLFIPATKASLHYVTTLTADATGSVWYDALLKKGDTSSCIGGQFPCNGLLKPISAEIHSALFVPNGGPGRQAAQFWR
jgi:hypothetical protein